MSVRVRGLAGVAAAAAALLNPDDIAEMHARRVRPERERQVSPSYTKRGPGRVHQSGRPAKWPFKPGETAVKVKPERAALYLHGSRRRRT